MSRSNWQIFLGIILLVLSTVGYIIHYLIFRDAHHIFIFLVGDIAFVFIEVLMVTLVIHNVLETREKKALLSKLNMVIGAFFSEVGTKLLVYFNKFDIDCKKITSHLIFDESWSAKDFDKAVKDLRGHHHAVKIEKHDLAELSDFLIEKRGFMLRLLENPNLLEHASFTDLLWAVFHLTEEMAVREDVTQMTDADFQHIVGDINRAFAVLITEWLDYMKHLKVNYPYLFSLAARTNPFNPNAGPVIKDAKTQLVTN
ncbi:hypothetical protein LCGC14_0526970 [marine sediment metagenome]|uniref:Uncharacterized protein n=1 Tax=marine sediment metagenome TaxID=412755 RepID=A0A0F9RX06_9ZZZZ